MRRSSTLVALVATLVVSAAPVAHAGTPMPQNASAFGRSHTAWAKAWSQWAFGDASNPLIASLSDGDCGDLIGGVFYLAAPIDAGLTFDCDVPVGTPIVLTHAGFFTTIGVDGTTDAEIEAAAIAAFAPDPGSDMLTLDGRSLARTTTITGAFDIDAASGSFFNAIVGLDAGSVRTAIVGEFTILHPLRPGDHELFGAVSFAGGANGAFDATYHLHVG